MYLAAHIIHQLLCVICTIYYVCISLQMTAVYQTHVMSTPLVFTIVPVLLPVVNATQAIKEMDTIAMVRIFVTIT